MGFIGFFVLFGNCRVWSMAADDSRRNLSSDTGKGLWSWTGGEAGLNFYFLLVILGTKKN